MKKREWVEFVLNRPAVANAVDEKTMDELKGALTEARKNGVKVFVVRSQVPGVFCSGGDLSQFKKLKTKQPGLRINKKMKNLLEGLWRQPFLTVAYVDGASIGGGCEILASFDQVLSSPHSRFSFRQSKMGVSTGWGGGKKLIHHVGSKKALDWLMTARFIGVDEAYRAGFVDRVILPSKLRQEVESLLVEMEHLTPKDILDFKNLVYRGAKNEDQMFTQRWMGTKHREALGL